MPSIIDELAQLPDALLLRASISSSGRWRVNAHIISVLR